MKRYTLNTIKKTKCYRANIEAVRAIYPGHEADFARELMIAANHLTAANLIFRAHESELIAAFGWMHTPQGDAPWYDLYTAIQKWKNGASKK